MKLLKSEILGTVTATIPGFGTRTFEFDFKKPTHVSAVVNSVLDEFSCLESSTSKDSYSWGDIPRPENEVIGIKRVTSDLVRKSDVYEERFAINGTAQDFFYKQLDLKIFPDKWELWQVEDYKDTVPNGGWYDTSSSGESTSRDSDGFMNK